MILKSSGFRESIDNKFFEVKPIFSGLHIFSVGSASNLSTHAKIVSAYSCTGQRGKAGLFPIWKLSLDIVKAQKSKFPTRTPDISINRYPNHINVTN